jgi:hypothetical protein
VLLELEQSSNGPRSRLLANLIRSTVHNHPTNDDVIWSSLLVVYLLGSHLLAFVHRVMAVSGGGHPRNSTMLQPQWCFANFVESDRAIPLVPPKLRGELIRHTL